MVAPSKTTVVAGTDRDPTPLPHYLAGRVTLVATPIYDCAGCGGGSLPRASASRPGTRNRLPST